MNKNVYKVKVIGKVNDMFAAVGNVNEIISKMREQYGNVSVVVSMSDIFIKVN